MIQLGILVPLAVGGLASAVWREYQQRKHQQTVIALPTTHTEPHQQGHTIDATPSNKATAAKPQIIFDDVGELSHYQRIAWYTLAFSASASWFYPPIILLSIPLLGYNSYHFLRTINKSAPEDRTSPMTVFEVIGVASSLALGRPIVASVLLLFSFGSRKFLLHAGNFGNMSASRAFNPRLTKLWVLREGVEVEIPLAQLSEKDTIVLNSGDIVMVKAKILEGEGVIRQYSLRKKMKSIPKHIGDKVFPFTQLESGSLHVQKII